MYIWWFQLYFFTIEMKWNKFRKFRVACFFFDIGLYCESQGEKKEKMYKIQNCNRIPSSILFFLIHDLPFSPGHLLESRGEVCEPSCDFSPLCGARWQSVTQSLGGSEVRLDKNLWPWKSLIRLKWLSV